MNKNIIIIIGVIIIILILGFSFYTLNTVKIGNSYVTVPGGYRAVDEGNYINLTSGTNYICLIKGGFDENLNKSIDNYVNDKDNTNDSLKFSKFSTNGIDITKSSSTKNPNVFHYWFVKDGKTYQAFTWSGNSNTDTFLKNLINTMKPAI